MSWKDLPAYWIYTWHAQSPAVWWMGRDRCMYAQTYMQDGILTAHPPNILVWWIIYKMSFHYLHSGVNGNTNIHIYFVLYKK